MGWCALFRMHAMATDEDGFQVVKRRGRHSAASRAQRKGTASLELPITTSLSANDILAKVEGYKDSLQGTQFYHKVTDLLAKVDLSFSMVVCYGIGHVGSCSIAQQQFALLLLLLDKMKPSRAPQRCWVYDPVLGEQERTAIERSGCTLFTTNNMCKYTTKECTLFYMPHCGIAMYNNLLWANWEPSILSKIAIVGNRFSSYNERLPQRQFKNSLYVYRIFNNCQEHPLPNCYTDTTVFNDLAIHTFPQAKLLSLPLDTWTDPPEPIVDPLDPEIITSQPL